MKEVANNRARVSWSRKLGILHLALRENGIVWCLFFGLYYVSSSASDWAFRRMSRWRESGSLPGLNGPALNKVIWEAWDWQRGGDEWSGDPSGDTDRWKQSVLRGLLDVHIPRGGRILEIGPGAGRWTGALLARADEFLGIDISRSCIQQCAARFGSDPKATFVVGSGTDLAGVRDTSVDSIWSWDVFVHINIKDVEAYLEEISRVLRPGGMAVIHHGGVGGHLGGWRSNLSKEKMHALLAVQNLSLISCTNQWTREGTTFDLGPYGDWVSVFSKAQTSA